MASINPVVDLNENPIEPFSTKEFFRNKTIMITGSTGFIGKVLLAKLLKEFHLAKIYALVREKKSQFLKTTKTPQQRLDDLFSEKCPIFENLKGSKDLIQAIPADLSREDLGLSKKDRQTLADEVQVVFLLAASVNFTGTVGTFFKQNIDATDSLMKLCQDMNKLESVVYVSTAYANCQLDRIEERIYPVFDNKNDKNDFQDLETYLQDLRDNYTNLEPPEGHPILRGRPNLYTLSKSITELMIQERYSSKLPVIICRPSIVISSCYEPIPGWVDSYTGPTTFMLSAYVGFYRTWIVNPDVRQDMIPVDLVCNSLIIAAAFRGSPSSYTSDKMVVNLTANQYTFDWKATEEMCKQYPTMKMVRRIKLDQNKFETAAEKMRLYLKIWVLHYPLALILTLFNWMPGPKSAWKQFKKIEEFMFVLKPFTTKEWDLPNPNLKYITELLVKEERPTFPTTVESIDWKLYLKNYVLGVRKYMLKDPDSTLAKARNRQRWLIVLSWICKFVMFILLNVFLWSGLNMLEIPFLDNNGIILMLSAINFIYFTPGFLRNLCEPNFV